MTKTKLALVAIAMFAATPAALAEDIDSIPPNSADYGYVVGQGNDLQRFAVDQALDAQARALGIGRVDAHGSVSAQIPSWGNQHQEFDGSGAPVGPY